MSNERNKSKLDKIYRTDPPLGQAAIPAPPRFLDEIESFGFDLSRRPMSYFEDLTL